MSKNTDTPRRDPRRTKPPAKPTGPAASDRGYRPIAQHSAARTGQHVAAGRSRTVAGPVASRAVDRDRRHLFAWWRRPASPPDDRFAKRPITTGATLPYQPPPPATSAVRCCWPACCSRSASRAGRSSSAMWPAGDPSPVIATAPPATSTGGASTVGSGCVAAGDSARDRSAWAYSPELAEMELRRGDTLLDLLARAGMPSTRRTRPSAACARSPTYAGCQIGQRLALQLDTADRAQPLLARLVLPVGAASEVHLVRTPDGSFAASSVERELRSELAAVAAADRGQLLCRRHQGRSAARHPGASDQAPELGRRLPARHPARRPARGGLRRQRNDGWRAGAATASSSSPASRPASGVIEAYRFAPATATTGYFDRDRQAAAQVAAAHAGRWRPAVLELRRAAASDPGLHPDAQGRSTSPRPPARRCLRPAPAWSSRRPEPRLRQLCARCGTTPVRHRLRPLSRFAKGCAGDAGCSRAR